MRLVIKIVSMLTIFAHFVTSMKRSASPTNQNIENKLMSGKRSKKARHKDNLRRRLAQRPFEDLVPREVTIKILADVVKDGYSYPSAYTNILSVCKAWSRIFSGPEYLWALHEDTEFAYWMVEYRNFVVNRTTNYQEFMYAKNYLIYDDLLQIIMKTDDSSILNSIAQLPLISRKYLSMAELTSLIVQLYDDGLVDTSLYPDFGDGLHRTRPVYFLNRYFKNESEKFPKFGEKPLMLSEKIITQLYKVAYLQDMYDEYLLTDVYYLVQVDILNCFVNGTAEDKAALLESARTLAPLTLPFNNRPFIFQSIALPALLAALTGDRVLLGNLMVLLKASHLSDRYKPFIDSLDAFLADTSKKSAENGMLNLISRISSAIRPCTLKFFNLHALKEQLEGYLISAMQRPKTVAFVNEVLELVG